MIINVKALRDNVHFFFRRFVNPDAVINEATVTCVPSSKELGALEVHKEKVERKFVWL